MKTKLAVLTAACIGLTSFTASSFALSKGEALVYKQLEQSTPHINKVLDKISLRINEADGDDVCVFGDALSAANTQAADYIDSTQVSAGCIAKFTFKSDHEIAAVLRGVSLEFSPVTGAERTAWSQAVGKKIDGFKCHITPGDSSILAVTNAQGVSTNLIMKYINKDAGLKEVIGNCVVDSGFSAPTYLTE